MCVGDPSDLGNMACACLNKLKPVLSSNGTRLARKRSHFVDSFLEAHAGQEKVMANME
jgi:hypothetical protein